MYDIIYYCLCEVVILSILTTNYTLGREINWFITHKIILFYFIICVERDNSIITKIIVVIIIFLVIVKNLILFIYCHFNLFLIIYIYIDKHYSCFQFNNLNIIRSNSIEIKK